jgi:hypothetical protein
MHYYLHEGFKLDYIAGLSYQEKLFLAVSMEQQIEQKAKREP